MNETGEELCRRWKNRRLLLNGYCVHYSVTQRHVRISLLQEIATLLGLLSIPQTLLFWISLTEFLSSILIMQSSSSEKLTGRCSSLNLASHTATLPGITEGDPLTANLLQYHIPSLIIKRTLWLENNAGVCQFPTQKVDRVFGERWFFKRREMWYFWRRSRFLVRSRLEHIK